MLDDLRSDFEDFGDSEEEQLPDLPIDFDEIEAQQQAAKPEKKFLGMTAGERAFLSAMVFFIVLVFGVAILAVTGRIAF